MQVRDNAPRWLGIFPEADLAKAALASVVNLRGARWHDAGGRWVLEADDYRYEVVPLVYEAPQEWDL